MDALNDHICLGFQRLDGFAVFARGHIQQVHLDLGTVFALSPADQLVDGVVCQLRHIGPHHRAEDLIGGFQHIVAAAEVLLQDDSPVFRVQIVGISPQTLHEQGRICLAEAVNRLLHVADHEHDVIFVVDRLQDRVLNLADVLTFVHKNMVILALHLGTQGRIGQHLHGELLHVREIDQVLFRLFLQKCLVNGSRQHRKPLQMPLHHAELDIQAAFIQRKLL